jgi:hypothetical protein
LYIERDDQLHGCYGGLGAAILRKDELRLIPSDERNAALGIGLAFAPCSKPRWTG